MADQRIVIARLGESSFEGRVVGKGPVGIGKTPADTLKDMATLYPNLFVPGTITSIEVRNDPFLEE